MELLTPVLTKIASRLAIASLVLLACAMVALYGDLWGVGQAYPLLSPYHRAMVMVTIVLIVLMLIYRLPSYLIMAIGLINIVWLLGPLLTIGEISPLAPLLPRALICSIIAMIALGYYISVLAIEAGNLPQKFSSLALFSRYAPPRYPELQQWRKEWRRILIHLKRQVPLRKRLFCQTSANTSKACVMVVGPSKSGKTSALLNAELILTLPSQQLIARQAFRCTEQPQFWLADNALWCDTPGRYFDPDPTTPDAADEWQALTKQLVGMKSVTTIEAIVFVIDCPRLLSSTPQQLADYAALCRTHLRILQQQIDRQLSLTLFVSQLDQLVGFQEYFHDLPLQERYQLLGEKFEQGRKEPLLNIDRISQHLNLMVKRIDKQVLTKQQQCDDVLVRKGIERFPVNLEALTRALLLFIEPLVFLRPDGSPSEYPALQGVYLGCSELCQESVYTHPQSLVRQWLEDANGQRYALAKQPEETEDHVLETLPRSFRHYFIKTLFQYRIIDDYRLRLSLHQQHIMTRLRRGALLMAILIISAGSIYAVAQHYYDNQHFFTESQQALTRLDEELSATQLPLDLALNKLTQLTITRRQGGEQSSSLFSDWERGLAEQWAERTTLVYNQWLYDHLLPSIEKVAFDDLTTQLSMGDPQKLLATLSVYLMLHGELERDSAFLERWFSAHPTLITLLEHKENLPLLLRRLFSETSWKISSFTADKQLVESARQLLLQQPLSDYLYHDIVQQLEAISLPIIDLPQLITSSHPLLFTFTGKVNAAAGLYNLHGVKYWDKQVATTHFPNALARVMKILYGTRALSLTDPQYATQQELWQQVSLMYWKAYRDHWQDFLKGLRLNLSIADNGASQVKHRQRIEYLLKDFTRPESQLRQLLVNVAQQTQLSLTQGGDRIPTTSDLAEEVIQEKQQRRENVDQYFIALHRFVETSSTNTTFTLEQLELALTQLYVALQATGVSTEQQFKALVSEQAKTSDFTTILLHLDQLPVPLPQLFETLLSVAQQQVSKQTRAINAEQINQEIIQYCRQHLMGRYPFAPSGGEADPHSVAEMFSPQGKLARYFTQYLADKVDTHQRPWRFVTADQAISPRLLSLFEQGKKIQQQLFPQSSQQLGIDITLTVNDLASAITQLIIDSDEQQFRYVHGPILQQKIRWPTANPSPHFQIRAIAAQGQLLWNIEEKGYWGIFRWLERSKKQFGARNRQTEVTLGGEAEQAVLTVNGLGTSVTDFIRLFRHFDCSIAE